ncbi:MAG: bL21 family ribosomal protein [Phycisphaerales bacterium]
MDVIKFKRRKGYRRKTGHRQRLLKVRIGEISAK